MRFAGLLLCAISLCAQPVAAPPGNLNARVALLQRLWNSAANPSGVTFEEARALRREHILWLIRNHPEHPAHMTPEARIDPSTGRLADPQGYVEAAALWKEAAAKPGAPVEVIANAAFFLGVSERLAAYSILNAVWPAQQSNPRVAKVRGILDAMEVIGAKGMSGPYEYVRDKLLATSPEAAKARAELGASTVPALVGAAGQTLADLVFARDDTGLEQFLAFGERLLKRAATLEPGNPLWKSVLTANYMSRASRVRDPIEKARLYREGLETSTIAAQRTHLLGMLAEAEFDAGQTSEAEQDAAKLLTAAAPRSGDAIHQAHTLLGRVAMKRGDLATAKQSLLASARVESTPTLSSFGPGMQLAQQMLDAGERDVVIEFLELSRKIWTKDQRKIDAFVKAIKTDPSATLLSPAERGPSLIAGTRPPAFKLKDLAGKEWSLAALSGKVIALDFWAIWCAPCREEMPALNRVAQEMAVRGVVVLAIDAHEPEETVRAWITQNPQSIPVVLGDEATIRAYLVSVYPTLIVIDRKGVIADVSVGRLSEAELRKAIEKGFAPAAQPKK
jgi:thiol-disulfide isomerase/thioredoxin